MAKSKKKPAAAPKKPKKPKRPPVPPDDAPPPAAVGHPPGDLSDDEERFVVEYLVDRCAAHAYRRAFPGCSRTTARAAGHRMRNLPHVAQEISAELAALNRRIRVGAEDVLREIARVAYSDILELYNPVTGHLYAPRHIPFDTRRAIASVKVNRLRTSVTRNGRTKTTVTEQEVEYKLWPKMDALGKLCAHLGLNTEITPLESLLRALPGEMAAQIRTALATPRGASLPVPSTNGHAPHPEEKP